MSPALEAQSLNHWTTREVPKWQNSSLTSARGFSVYSRLLTRVVEVTELQRHEKHVQLTTRHCRVKDDNTRPHRVFIKKETPEKDALLDTCRWHYTAQLRI